MNELIKARRTTQGPSSQVHALFGMVSTTVSIVEYGETIAPWLHEARQQNHLSTESLLSATEAQAFVSFIRQCAHDSTLPTEHRGIYQKIFADILADTEADASTFNMIRWKPHLEQLRITFTAKNLKMGSGLAEDLRVLQPSSKPPKIKETHRSTPVPSVAHFVGCDQIFRQETGRGARGGRGRRGGRSGSHDPAAGAAGGGRGDGSTKTYQGWCFRCGNKGHSTMECQDPTYDIVKGEAARAQALRDRAASEGRNLDRALRRFTKEGTISSDSESDSEDNGSYENDNRSSSCPEFPHVDSTFIFHRTLAHLPSSPCISILRMPDQPVKSVHVHHAARRYVHTIPPLASYNRENLQTRTEMRILGALNEENRKEIRTADGLDKLPHGRRRILRKLQLQTYDVIQLLPCLSLFCTCPLCLDITSCRLAPDCKCSKCSAFYQFGVWNEAAASINFSLPRKPTTPYVYTHATDKYLPHLEHPTLRSPKDVSLIRLLQTPLSIHQGAVMDTGCQRPASHDPQQTLATTNKSFLVKGALGEPTYMDGIIMGCETIDTNGDQLLLVVPGESVFSSKLTESLINVAVLMEAGFDVHFRIPTDATIDAVDPIIHPDYGGHITTPDGRQVMMIYYDKTWRLPQRASLSSSRPHPPHFHASLNPCASLAQGVPVADDNRDDDNMASPLLDASEHSDLSEVEQRRFEIRLNRQAEVQNLHNSFGHPNNQVLLQHCQHAKIGPKYLKRYILSFECAFCQAALGRRSYIKHKRKRAALPPPTDTTLLPPSTPTIVPDVFLHLFKA